MRDEFVASPPGGRIFSHTRRPALGDCAPSGRMRLDALARWLQDVAFADVEDAGVADAAVWVVRRSRMRVERFPQFGERYKLATWCSGVGRMWAERRTAVVREDGSAPDVEAVALWVHLDPDGTRPTPLTEAEFDLYGRAAAARRVSARLRHPAPRGADSAFPWTFRGVDLDLAGHINNAAYWHPLEEELLAGEEPPAVDVEIEYRAPLQPGQVEVRSDGTFRWIVGDDAVTYASIALL